MWRRRRSILVLPTWDQIVAFHRLLQDSRGSFWAGKRRTTSTHYMKLSAVTFLALISSGLRLGEWLSLRVQDIDWASRMAQPTHESQDTKRSWFSFLSLEAAEALKEYLAEYPPSSKGYLFLTYRPDYASQRVIEGKVRNSFDLVQQGAGIRLYPHLLRSIFADRLGMVGIPDRFRCIRRTPTTHRATTPLLRLPA
ncbi:MAG: site-specific integrase [Candidatus Bathyarchaeia archaeon]